MGREWGGGGDVGGWFEFDVGAMVWGSWWGAWRSLVSLMEVERSRSEPHSSRLARVNTQFASLLDEWLPTRKHSELLELETSRTWCDYLGEGRCDFTDDGRQMRSFTDEGYYVYDLPPRTRWFTPWAWASLGAWVAQSFSGGNCANTNQFLASPTPERKPQSRPSMARWLEPLPITAVCGRQISSRSVQPASLALDSK